MELADLVRAWRDSPTPARRSAVESFAKAHPKGTDGALARFALGVTLYEQKDFAEALKNLRGLSGSLPQIGDYAAYYQAAATVELKEVGSVTQDLAPLYHAGLQSPLEAKGWLLEGRALTDTDATAAVRLLRDHYSALPQPEGAVTLADAYRIAGDATHAADFYQRVYYRYLSGDAAGRAAAALVTLKDSMGAQFPAPLPEQRLQRADRLLEARDYPMARAEYQTLVSDLVGVQRDQARVRMGAADFLSGSTAAAYQYLRGLEIGESEADAERLFYLEECARRLTDDDEMIAAVKQLESRYPQSPWRLKALLGAANRYLLTNRPSNFLPLYQAVYDNFPEDPAAATSHWKVALYAYLEDKSGADDLLKEHLKKFPSHASASAAFYFLARMAERDKELPSAAAYYTRLAAAFPNTYYATLAREQLKRADLQSAAASAKTAEFLASLTLPEAKPVPVEPVTATATRIARSRLLRTAGLVDLADGELRFGARTDGQPALLAMEMASSADSPHKGLRMMKSLSSDYLNLPLASAPDKYWKLLFPLPYWDDLTAGARANNLDPYLMAGLIRQESEFDPQALSRANAYGLTQVRPATGREYAKRAGVSPFTNRALFQPAANLKIGSTIFRSMLDRTGGNLEQTLAGYNAGPARAAEWVKWRNFREPAEFVEAIPFTETRDYVQAVLRNADIYRRLYR
jgi:soluble lytic murein transglycosylase